MPGWDPVTGFGSVNFAKFNDVFGVGSDDNKNGVLSETGIIGVSVAGGVVGAGVIGAGLYYGVFASKSAGLSTPLIDPTVTKSPMV